MTVEDVRSLLAAEIEKAGSSGAWARTHGISPAYVSDVTKGHREPGEKILVALSVERVVTYRMAG